MWPSFLRDLYVTATKLVASTLTVVSNLAYSLGKSLSAVRYKVIRVSAQPPASASKVFLPEDEGSRLVQYAVTFLRKYTASQLRRQESLYWSPWERQSLSASRTSLCETRGTEYQEHDILCDDSRFARCVSEETAASIFSVFVFSLLSLFWKNKKRLMRSSYWKLK
jgi:hypothetical protein